MTARGDRTQTLAETVIENSLDGLAVLDHEGRYVLWNRAMERFAGKTADEVLGKPMFEVFPFLREHGLDEAVRRVLGGEVVTIEGVEYIEPDGARKMYDRVYLPLRVGAGAITGVVVIVRDATARWTAIDAVRRSEAKMRLAAETAAIGLWSWDRAKDAVGWDDTMCSIFGLPPGGGPRDRAGYLALIHPEDQGRSTARVARVARTGEWEEEYRIVRADGSVRWVISKAREIHVDGSDVVLGALFDVTERRASDDRRRAAQKLEAVGQLTAGIAHNFNNMLMGLLPNLELAARRAPEDLAPLLRSAEHSAQRAADLVRQLMTYAGRSRKSARRVEDVATIVARTGAFCQTTFDRRIALDVRSEGDALASLDATQFEQAVLNLLINARDAVADAKTTTPTVQVDVDVVREGAEELEGRPGDWVRVRVEDNGIGMDAETIQRIYEPFFTTKDVGKGTGLGLATTQGIVREHGGFITCLSEPGRGTRFSLYFPASQEGASHAAENGALPADAPTTRPRGKVLVVDDEDGVRRVVALMLEDAGFEVTTAACGEDAARLLENPEVAAGVALVLLDVSMPGMAGSELRARVRELAPRARVVYLTGYAYEAADGDLVLEKPLSEHRLVSALEAVLGD
ncbi:MAG TPA: PAS domain S-box protein [Polyangiaceae bacterium]|jgi:PAS domain S-box-containing protein